MKIIILLYHIQNLYYIIENQEIQFLSHISNIILRLNQENNYKVYFNNLFILTKNTFDINE